MTKPIERRAVGAVAKGALLFFGARRDVSACTVRHQRRSSVEAE
jgi:hypothetical protein